MIPSQAPTLESARDEKRKSSTITISPAHLQPSAAGTSSTPIPVNPDVSQCGRGARMWYKKASLRIQKRQRARETACRMLTSPFKVLGSLSGVQVRLMKGIRSLCLHLKSYLNCHTFQHHVIVLDYNKNLCRGLHKSRIPLRGEVFSLKRAEGHSMAVETGIASNDSLETMKSMLQPHQAPKVKAIITTKTSNCFSPGALSNSDVKIAGLPMTCVITKDTLQSFQSLGYDWLRLPSQILLLSDKATCDGKGKVNG